MLIHLNLRNVWRVRFLDREVGFGSDRERFGNARALDLNLMGNGLTGLQPIRH